MASILKRLISFFSFLCADDVWVGLQDAGRKTEATIRFVIRHKDEGTFDVATFLDLRSYWPAVTSIPPTVLFLLMQQTG